MGEAPKNMKMKPQAIKIHTPKFSALCHDLMSYFVWNANAVRPIKINNVKNTALRTTSDSNMEHVMPNPYDSHNVNPERSTRLIGYDLDLIIVAIKNPKTPTIDTMYIHMLLKHQVWIDGDALMMVPTTTVARICTDKRAYTFLTKSWRTGNSHEATSTEYLKSSGTLSPATRASGFSP